MWDLIVSVPDHCLSFYFALLFLSIAMTDVYQISIAFSDYFEITTAVVVRCGGREMSSRTLTECCYFYWGQTSDILHQKIA